MSPHSEDGALVGNNPEQSQSVRNTVTEQLATPVWRNSLQRITTSLKAGSACGPRAAHKETCGPKRCTGCTVQLTWMGPRTSVAVLRKASAVVLFTAYPVGGFPATLRIGPRPSHDTTRSMCCSGRKICYSYCSSSRTWDFIINGLWLHTQLTSICDRHVTMASELRRYDPCSRNSGGPRCSSGTWRKCLSKRPVSAVKLSFSLRSARDHGIGSNQQAFWYYKSPLWTHSSRGAYSSSSSSSSLSARKSPKAPWRSRQANFARLPMVATPFGVSV